MLVIVMNILILTNSHCGINLIQAIVVKCHFPFIMLVFLFTNHSEELQN